MFKKGVVSVEFLINFIIYLVLIIVLFSVSILPLQKLMIEHNLRKVSLILFQVGHLESKIDIYKAKDYAFKFIGLTNLNTKSELKTIIDDYLKNTNPKDTFIEKLFNIENFISGYELNYGGSSYIFPRKIEIVIDYPLTFFDKFNLGFWVKDKFIGLKFERRIYIYIND